MPILIKTGLKEASSFHIYVAETQTLISNFQTQENLLGKNCKSEEEKIKKNFSEMKAKNVEIRVKDRNVKTIFWEESQIWGKHGRESILGKRTEKWKTLI